MKYMDDFKKYLDYDLETGFLHWKKRSEEDFRGAKHVAKRWNSRFCGKKAGNISTNGYVQVQVNGVNYRAHRVIWLMYYGELPKGDIDHINGIRHDNRICNLRDVSRTDNLRNSRQRSAHITGVYTASKGKPWRAAIQVNNKQISLGYFDCFCDALKARKIAEVKYGFHRNHGRFVRAST